MRLRMLTYSCSYAVRPRFVTQPPDDLRKSNFFNFTIEFRSGNDLVEVVEATFLQFLNEEVGSNIRNGTKYKVRFKYPNEVTETKHLYITLVDAATSELIRYEGHDDNPKMKRVLLTHEAICTRCSMMKSCGNKNEAPSDPLIISKGTLKFFMKCNQNCLKNAGNPRDMRRFSIAVSFDDITHDQSFILARSSNMFVHNNSKHNRKRKKTEDIIIKQEPISDDCGVLAYVHPRVGIKESSFAFYSKDLSEERVSFRFENMPLIITSILPKVAVTVLIPHQVPLGTLTITVYMDNTPVFSFPYEVQDRHRAYFCKTTSGFLCLCQPNPEGYPAQMPAEHSIAYVMMPPATHNGQAALQTTPYNYRRFPQENFQHGAYHPPPPLNPIPYGYGQQQYCPTSPSSNSTNISSTDSSPTYLY